MHQNTLIAAGPLGFFPQDEVKEIKEEQAVMKKAIPEVSPVIAATVPSKEYAVAFWNGLIESGVYVNLMLPPATPSGLSLLRCSVSAAHSSEQLANICQAFKGLYDKLKT